MSGVATTVAAAPRSALPHQPTPLVGRDAQLRQLDGLFRDQRLITLTGAPGSGKTRLAIEAARRATGSFDDGAWFVPLAPILDPDLIAHGVAKALGLKEEAGSPMRDVVGRDLNARNLLLILDNFEHLLDGATVVSDWLAGAPRLAIVVTSRAPLHLSGECEFAVPPLATPPDPDDPAAADTEAVRLFNARAWTASPGFEPDRATLRVVARICRRLDGLPLALELAAVRVKALPVSAILERLERSLQLLTFAARDVPERHRSLHAAVSWSYGLLAPPERAFHRRLSVFRGGWSLEAADAVTAATEELGTDPLELTSSLLDESLIERRMDAVDEPRYDILETLREYGHERLLEAHEEDDVAERHAMWYLGLAERAAPSLTGVDRGPWLDRLERESDNFRAALRWTIDRRHAALGMRLGAALWRFWQIRAHINEGRQILDELLALDAEVDPGIRARALSAAGSLAYWQYDAGATVRHYEASLELRKLSGDPAEIASGLYDLGHAVSVLVPVMDSPRGRALELEALEMYRTLGDRNGEAWLVWAIGCNAYFAADHEAARVDLATSIDLFRGVGDSFGIAWALTMHGLAASAVGRANEAEVGWREALQIFAEVDDVSGIETNLQHFSRLAAARGDARRAIRLRAAAARVRGLSQASLVTIAYRGDEGARPARVPLPPDEMEAERRRGEAMSTSEAVAYALDLPMDSAAGIRVRALGAMQAERGGERLTRWGGDKAGSRQAQAIVAFLIDRGRAGIAKDEATELIWPELSIRRADLAFHRTLGGLRSVLGRGPDGAESIPFDGGRYRLAEGIVEWTDVGAFEALLDEAGQREGTAAIEVLEEARRLYRGDLFDDCPIYGDSSFVEGRRAYLRSRYEDLLVDLGDRYAAALDEPAAAGCYRHALMINAQNARARSGLDRLGPEAAADVG